MELSLSEASVHIDEAGMVVVSDVVLYSRMARYVEVTLHSNGTFEVSGYKVSFHHNDGIFDNYNVEDFQEEYIETIPASVKKSWFGLRKKVIPEQKVLKLGWIEKKKSDKPFRYVTNNYRIVKSSVKQIILKS